MKKIILLCLALMLATSIFADVIIGTGTSTGRYPLNDYYVYSRSQCIYTAAEIGVPAGGTITHLRWYRDDTGADPNAIGTTEIWLTETTETTLSTWQTEGSLVATVSNIDLGAGGGWLEVDIDDFTYTGSNLMVTVRTQNAPYTAPHSYWRYTSTSDYKSLLGNSDSTNPPTVSTSYSRPNITLVGITQTTPPGIASLVFPTPSGVTGVGINPTLSWAAGSGTPTGYDVYFGETLPAEGSQNADHTVQTTTTWAPGILDYETTYSWKIVPWNAYGHPTYADCPTWTFTTMDDPLLSSFPWTENFGTLSTDPFPPIHWNKYSGLLADPTVLGDTGTGSWVQDDWLNVIDPANKAARMNVYGTSINGWLISRPIQMPGPGYQLEFDLGLTDYFNSNPPEDPTGLSGVDDRFIVLIGDGTSWTPANVVREWNNSGSDDVYNNIPYTGAHVTIPLDSYTGVKYIAFYAESTVSNADNDLFVDNVMVRETPSVAEFNLIPDIANWDFGTLAINNAATKTFTISNTGGAALTFNSISVSGDYYSPNPAFDLSSIPAGQSRDFTVQFLPTIEGGPYTGNFDISFNRETRSVALSGSAIDPAISYAELPYSTGFEDAWTGSPAAPEPGWTVINSNSDSYTWRRGASYIDAHTGDWFAQGMGNTDDWMITPPLNTGSYLKLKWWDAVESASYPNSYKVLLSTTDTNPASFTTELADITCSSTTWTEHNLTINNTSGTAYIAFHQYASGSTIYDFGIDDLVIEELPLTPPLAPTLTYPLQLTGLPQVGFNLTWTPDPASGPVDYYIVYFWDDDSVIGDGPIWETSGTSFDPTQALTDPITYGYLDRWNWTVQAYSSAYPETEAFATESWFEIQDDPTIVVDPGTPWTEGFENATFPPNNWALISGSGNWTRSVAAGGYGDSTASAYAGFYNISGSTPFSMVTPLLDLSALTTPTLMFDYAYATYSGELDRMDVYYSIDGGLSYSTLLEMPGGADGILNTGGTTTSSFVPTAGQWNTQTLALPAGTNMLKFTATSAYGNNLYLDNVFVGNPPVFWDLTMLDPVGSGTVVPAIGEHSYIENSVVNLTAQPGLGWFEKWEVDGVQYSTDRIAPLTMDTNYEAQAFFSLPAGSLAEDFNLGDPVPGEWSETATTVAWEMGDDTFFFNMFDSFTMIGQVATDPEEMLITPEVILDGSINKFSYWLAGGNNIYGYGSSTVQVKYQAPGTRVWTNLGAPIDLATNEALQYVSLDLSAIPNGTYQFAFAVSSTFDYSTYLSWVGIDNVVGPRLADVVMNDLAVTQVNYPNQIISDGETAVLSATIKNNGLNPQSGTQVTFTINDGRTVLTTNIGTLNYNDTEIVTVNYTTVGGRHTITASVPADDNLTNNSATTQGIIAVEGNLAEGFEGTVDGWTLGDASQWTLNNITWLPPYEGNWAAYCYGATFTDDRLVTPKLVLTGSEELNFYASFGNQSTGAASLAVDYSADGVTWTNILPAFAPTENSQLYTVDLSTIPAGEYYLAFNGSGTNDGTYNTILNLDFVFGPELAIVDVDTPANVAIALVGGTPQLSWEEVPAAGSYNIYSSADPYGEFTLLGSTAALSYDLTADQAHLFYHVTASTDVRQVAAANIPNVSLRAQTSLNAAQAPQITPAGNLKTNNRNRQQVILPKK